MNTLRTLASFSLVLTFVFTTFLVFGVNKTFAAPQPLPFDFEPGFGDVLWEEIENDGGDLVTGTPFSGDCQDSGTGLNIDDAESANGDSDAYDTAWLTAINDTFIGTSGVGDLTGGTYTGLPVNISGLDVTYQLFFSDSSQCNRLVIFLDNNTGAAIGDTFRIATNFGSDDGTVVVGTSSSDNNFTTADRWIVTADDTVDPSDPVNTTVFFGNGNPEVTPNFVTNFVCDDSDEDGVGAQYDFTVPANESRCLMFFACLGDITGMGNTIAGALDDAPLFDNNFTIPGNLLSGLTPDQLAGCLNWDFDERTAVPTISEWGMIAMAGVLGIIGIFVLRRRMAAQS